MIEIVCPKCQSRLAVEDSLAGTTLECPDCATRFRVPGSTPLDTGFAIHASPSVESIQPTHSWSNYAANEALEPNVALPPPSAEDMAVLAEIQRLQHQQPSWWGAIGVLIITLMLYMAAARTQEIWEGIAFLI